MIHSMLLTVLNMALIGNDGLNHYAQFSKYDICIISTRVVLFGLLTRFNPIKKVRA